MLALVTRVSSRRSKPFPSASELSNVKYSGSDWAVVKLKSAWFHRRAFHLPPRSPRTSRLWPRLASGLRPIRTGSRRSRPAGGAPARSLRALLRLPVRAGRLSGCGDARRSHGTHRIGRSHRVAAKPGAPPVAAPRRRLRSPRLRPRRRRPWRSPWRWRFRRCPPENHRRLCRRQPRHRVGIAPAPAVAVLVATALPPAPPVNEVPHCRPSPSCSRKRRRRCWSLLRSRRRHPHQVVGVAGPNSADAIAVVLALPLVDVALMLTVADRPRLPARRCSHRRPNRQGLRR